MELARGGRREYQQDMSATSTIDESLFPRDGSPSEKLEFLLQYAIQAPSVRNTQPWSFSLAQDTLELRADASRKLRHVDPEGRELTISCGAALEHLVLALRFYGHEAAVEHLPDHREPRLLARIGIGPRVAAGSDNLVLFYAIFKRTTERSRFKRRAIPHELRENLAAVSAGGDVRVTLLEEQTRRAAIAGLVAEANRIQGADPHYRDELASWWTPHRSRRLDGVPAHARGLGFIGSALEQLMIETADLGAKRAASNRRRIVDAPMLAVLGTAADETLSWLLCGRALARLLLRARAAGLAASFFSEPTQVPAVRKKLAALLPEVAFPQVVLRLGYTADTRRTRTPRRPVHEILSR